MRSFYLLSCACAFLLLAVPQAASESRELRIRQDRGASSDSSTPLPSTSSPPPSSSTDSASRSDRSSTPSTSPKPTTSQTPSSTDIPRSSTTDGSSTSTESGQAPTDSSDSSPTSTPTPTSTPNVLPLPPLITPAVGIAGAVLLLSGLAYCLIGIKHKWLHIFLAPAYLSSLAIVVLIEYVIDPPVSNAVQGAYFVAAFMTGCIFGGVSLIFVEVTEGLGCLLGGFCLSMWFLVLKAGGLLTSTAGKAIFIGVFTVVGYSLSFSQHTRTYGLIGCISFAGATVTVIGIDCFSRAGLKEFWLYLWNLNNKTFPLNTNTYPITRGIKVEIAGIIVLFLLGIISQLKVWKLVKERREKKATEQLEEERIREQREADLGRQIEHHNAKARKQWERIYGDKESAKNILSDSGIGSSGASFQKSPSVSIREVQQQPPQNGVELLELPESINGSIADLHRSYNWKLDSFRGSSKAPSDVIQEIDVHGNPLPPSHPSSTKGEAAGYANSTASSDPQYSSASFKNKSLRPNVAPPPVVIPMPFEVGAPDDESPSSAEVPVQRRKPTNNRLSQLSMANRFSTAASFGDELSVPHLEDDRRSSMAATLNDKMDRDSMYLPRLSPFEDQFPDSADTPEVTPETKSELGIRLDNPSDLKPADALPRSRSDTDLKEMQAEAEAKEKERISEIPLVDPAVMQAAAASLTSSTIPKEETTKGKEKETSNGEGSTQEPATTNEQTSDVGGLKAQLPDTLSKIALSYRTNEWAKHLDKAEEPEDESDSRPSTPGVRVEVRAPEPPVQPKVVEPQQSPVAEKRPQAVARDSSNSFNVRRTSKATPVYASQANSSTSLVRNNSNSSVYNINEIQRNASKSSMRNSKSGEVGKRSSSMPFSGQPLMESPMEEPSSEMNTNEFARMNPAYGTLLDVAGKKQLNRTSSAINRQSSAPNMVPMTSSESSSNSGRIAGHGMSSQAMVADDDDMPLSQRRSMIQAQRNSPGGNLIRQSTGFDSHQPRRTSGIDTKKQSANLALWRESVRADMASKTPKIYEEENARNHMMMQRRESQMKLEHQAAAAQHRESAMDNMMRRGDMLELHREKMRKMQATANRNAS
ncbi:MAG: hypothetical protein M1820_000154 [Bogoriella megaspora]|nr:MAG: hypothetical protein M1820_000154 [Bogoriella megaspora]